MDTIFIQIASYRDRELIPTVQDAIAQAAHPERLSFGICWQYQTEEELQYIEPLKNLKNCRIDAVNAAQSRGAGWARFRTQKLWRGEQYTLQIDSHIRFAPRWDIVLIDMLAMCPSKKAILTAYPPGYEPPRTLLSNIPSRVVPANFDQSGVLVLMSEGDLTECSTPQIGAFIAAGFMFADASIIQQVPYDPEIYFYGEEVLFSARAWTRGWDIYHPHQAVCWHYYNSVETQTRPVHWADHQNWWTFNGVSEQRFRQIMKMEPSSKNFGVYGLGKTRTLEEYEAIAGVQFREWKKDKNLSELLLYCVRPQMNSIVAEKIITLLQEEINWDSLLQIAAIHRVLPLLYWSLKNMHPEVIPQSVLNKLKNNFQSNTVHNLRLTKELLKLLNLLKENGIRAIPFKGPVLAASVYKNLALRQFVDLDILVTKQDYTKAQKLLISQGYEECSFDLDWQVNLVHKNSKINIDLHKQITPNYCPLGLDFEHLWSRLKPIDLAGTEVLSLSPEDLLLILCAQAAKDFMEYGEQLAQICDIAQLLYTHQNLDWEYIIKQAKFSGNRRVLLLYLFLANELLGANLPDEIFSYIEAEPIVKSLAVQVRERLLYKDQHLSSLLIDPIFYLKVRERLQDKIQYFLNYINPVYYLKGRKRIWTKLKYLIKFSSKKNILSLS